MSSSAEMLSVLEDTAALLQKTQINLKKCSKARLTKGYIEARLKIIDYYWQTFKQAHQDLLKVTPKEKRGVLPYFLNEEFYIYEDLYVVLQADLSDMLTSLNSSMTSNNTSASDQEQSKKENSLVKLPRIQLPTFSGSYEEWPTFEDLFISLIHKNKTIEDAQKLHYLKSSLSGEAASLIRHIQVTHKNYTQAWDVLKTRYGNKKIIINSILRKLFLQRKITSQSANQLKCLLDTTTECLNNLKNLDINVDSWDPMIIFLVVQKMDQESHKEWEEYAYKDNSEDLPTWNDLTKFLQSKYRTLELTSSSPRERNIKERSFHVSTASPEKQSESSELAPPRPLEKKCIMCKGNHTLCHCKEFTNLQPTQRSDYVKIHNLCFNCLVPGHAAHKCRLRMFCRICSRRHHLLLHQIEKKENNTSREETAHQSASHCNIEEREDIHVNSMIASHYTTKQGIALLATAMVTVRSEHNHTRVLRALIDQGSQASFISEKAAQRLRLTKQPARGTVVGVGSTRTNVNHVVKFQVSSQVANKFNLPVKAFVMSKQLTTKIPAKKIAANHWSHLEGLNLADPSYHTPGSIDLLLGVKEYAQILQPELIKGPPGTPSAQKTNLGWILFGEVEDNAEQDTVLVMHHQVELDEVLKSIWEIEIDTKRKLTREEQLCEEIYENTHTRIEEGRYMVKLPFNTKTPICTEGNTRGIAEERLLQLERRFKRIPKLREDYTNVMEEYLHLQHMEEVPKEEKDKENSVYLPHHAVLREDKETTKTRLVFDASCKGSNNVSLNDELLVGPPLQEDLRNLIMRWRMKRICYMSDIQKMYRQILVFPEDADTYQRILWRSDENKPIKEYRILRVTFGTASAPYLAVRTLHQIAEDEGQNYPKAAQIIKNNFFMDDLMSGADTVEEAVAEAKEINEILKKGGFTLAKWISNNLDFMQFIKPEDRSCNAHVDLNIDGTVKALGIKWNMGLDKFQYGAVIPPIPVTVTKRSILSDLQKLFDPLGWIAPSIVMTKLFIQKLWLEKLNWDDKISTPLLEEWINIRSDFQQVNDIEVDRWIGTTSKTTDNLQVHGFCDASMQAYAAVVYARIKTENGTIKTILLASRTRVAPLRTISLPRLELCGALLLSHLLKQVAQAMRVPSSQIFAWTDSTIVLAWLAGDPHKWKLFVANRVVEIVENVHCSKWHHVDSKSNPADIASRGMLLSELKSCELWWRGPKWLLEKEIQFFSNKVIETDLEMKKNKIQVNFNMKEEEEETKDNKLTEQFEKFENLQEMLKVLTYCRRFLNHKKNPSAISERLKTEELDRSLKTCIRLVQQEEFLEDIKRLKNNKPVKTNSNLKSLNPYLDEAGILRVGGRLRHSELEEKHPIILGTKNNLTPLIIADAHIRTMHGGVQLMSCYLRSKFWILKGKGLIKKHVHKCLICAKQRATVKTQIMGDLPKERVTPARPFLNSGVDFCGPFQILNYKGRGAKTRKAYIALFICMSTKAIHLELVSDLTSEAFIGAFRRFVARRGNCINLWSDQGRNFIGADKQLQAAWRDAGLTFEKTAETLALDGTQWHFIPPYSPNFGGLWESGVKSVKHHLKRILTTNLTFEEMNTILCQIEACLNSRPLSPIDTDDPDAIESLTPGHFLIGQAPIIVPSANLTDTPISNLTRWQHLQKLVGDFWRRWQAEYLSRLQQRPKWQRQQREFKLGDIVLVKIEGLPPGKWCLGRVVGKHPGSDGHTRVYSIKSGSNIVKRCVTKLCYLPIDTES